MDGSLQQTILDVIHNIIWFGGIPFTMGLALWVVHKFCQSRGLVRVFSFISIFIGISVFYYLCVLGVVLRDGLGPDSIQSSGLEAVRRAFPGIVEALVVGFILSIPGLVLMRRGRRNAV